MYKYDLNVERQLKNLGFKKEWFQDRSGFWFVKPINHLDIKMQLYVQFSPDMLFVEVKTGDYFSRKLTFNKYYDPIKTYKLSMENIKMLIKKYK